MRNILTNIRSSQATVINYDPDFQAWIDYNIAQGNYMTSDTVKLSAANQYIISSKADGTWDSKDVFHLFAWNDLQMDNASLVCLKRLIKVDVYGGMTYTVNGWEGNRVDGYIDSLFTYSIDGVNYTKDDAGRGICVYKNQSTGLGELFGISTHTGYMTMYNANQTAQRINTGWNLNASADLTGIGLKTQYRDDDTNVRLYNKSTEMTRTLTSTTNGDSDSLCLFQRNNQYFSDVGASAFFFSKSFTETENESIRTNLNTYLTSIGLTAIA